VEIQNRIKTFYRSLDPYAVDVYDNLDYYSEVIRKQAESLNTEEKYSVFGMISEETAKYLLRVYTTQFPGFIIDNLIFQYDKGKTTEIDILFLTPNQLYVIESKHRSQNIIVNSDGTLNIGGRVEDPISQNIGHIRKLLKSTTYGYLVPMDRITSIIYFTLNKCRVNNPITIFKKGDIVGAFANSRNLLSLLHQIELSKPNGKIPYQRLGEELLDLGKNFRGEEGRLKHINNLKALRKG